MDTSTIFLIILGTAFVLFYFFKKINDKYRLSPQNFKEMRENEPGLIIDVRTEKEHRDGHLKLTDRNINIMNPGFEQKIEKLDKNKAYYLYCRTGSRSARATRIMRKKGFEQAYNIGGFGELQRAGFE